MQSNIDQILNPLKYLILSYIVLIQYLRAHSHVILIFIFNYILRFADNNIAAPLIEDDVLSSWCTILKPISTNPFSFAE